MRRLKTPIYWQEAPTAGTKKPALGGQRDTLTLNVSIIEWPAV